MSDTPVAGLRDPLECLPIDLFLLVVSSLSAEDLRRAAAVCSAWREICDSEAVWRPLCMLSWAGKLPLKANCDAPPYAPDEAGGAWRGRGWKERHGRVERELRRTAITAEDLTGTSWRFRLRASPNASPDRVVRTFTADGNYVCPWFIMKWSILEGAGSPRGERDLLEGSPGRMRRAAPGPRVQVGDFPPFLARRSEDHGWVLTNNYVELRSTGFGPPAPTPPTPSPPPRPAPSRPRGPRARAEASSRSRARRLQLPGPRPVYHTSV
eukprot:tig00000480_g1322.t1